MKKTFFFLALACTFLASMEKAKTSYYDGSENPYQTFSQPPVFDEAAWQQAVQDNLYGQQNFSHSYSQYEDVLAPENPDSEHGRYYESLMGKKTIELTTAENQWAKEYYLFTKHHSENTGCPTLPNNTPSLDIVQNERVSPVTFAPENPNSEHEIYYNSLIDRPIGDLTIEENQWAEEYYAFIKHDPENTGCPILPDNTPSIDAQNAYNFPLENLPTHNPLQYIQNLSQDYPAKFEAWYRKTQYDFQQAELMRHQKGLYIRNKGQDSEDQLSLRERPDLPGVYRYHARPGGNCLFWCFALKNPELFKQATIYQSRQTSRDRFIDYIESYLHDPYVLTYLKRAQGSDILVRRALCIEENYLEEEYLIEEYLNAYRNPDIFPQALANVEQFTIQYEDSGFPIILAYLSGINLRVYAYSEAEQTQLIVNYKHPEGSTDSINLLVYNNHYTVLSMQGGNPTEIPEMERLEKKYAYLTWYKNTR